MTQMYVQDLFANEIQNGINIFMGGRDTYDYEQLTADEEAAIRLVFDKNVKRIENVSPKLAATLRPQREAFVKWGGVAKATFPETKSIAYPATAGGLGVDFITPELFNFAGPVQAATDDYDTPRTDYVLNTWDLNMVAGTQVGILGTAPFTTPFMYRGNAQENFHSFVVLAQDGLAEIGTTPKFTMGHFFTQLQDKYSEVAMQIIPQTIEENKVIYQMNTPGMIPMDHNVATALTVMPQYTGVSHIQLLGMVFYEYNFAAPDQVPRN